MIKGTCFLGLAACFGFIVLGGQPAKAADSSASSTSDRYVAALLGVGAYNNSGGTNFLYGLEGGYKFMSRLSAGLDVQNSSLNAVSPISANLLMILAAVRYYPTDLAGLNFGVKTGAALTLYSGSGAPATAANFVVGPTVGYDYGLSGNLSVGVDLAYLWVTSSPSISLFQGCGVLKYSF